MKTFSIIRILLTIFTLTSSNILTYASLSAIKAQNGYYSGVEVNGDKDNISARRKRKIIVLKGDVKSQFNKENVCYIIKKELDLKGETIVLPYGSELIFKRGNIINGAIIGNQSSMRPSSPDLLQNIRLGGTWEKLISYPEWFGAKGDGLSNDTQALLTVFNLTDNNEVVLNGEYFVTPDIIELKRSKLTIKGKNAIIFTQSKKHYTSIIKGSTAASDLTIDGVVFDQRKDSYIRTDQYLEGERCFSLSGAGTKILNCTFYGYGTTIISCNTGSGNRVEIAGNKVFFSRNGETLYDCSSIYVDSYEFLIHDNFIDGYYDLTNDSKKVCLYGGIECHGAYYDCFNNTITNCYVAINLVNHSTKSPSMLIHGFKGHCIDNRILNCCIGMKIWPISGGYPIENILIKGNTITLNGVDGRTSPMSGITTDTKSHGEVRNLCIEDNTIKYILAHDQIPSRPNIKEMGAIALLFKRLDSCSIRNNTVEGAYAMAINVSPTDDGTATDILVEKNNFNNCGISSYTEDIAKALNCIISIDKTTSINIFDNIIRYTTPLTKLKTLINTSSNCKIINVDGNCVILNKSDSNKIDKIGKSINIDNNKTRIITK